MKLSNGRERTISIKDLTLAGEQLLSEEEKTNNEEVSNNVLFNDSKQDISFSNVSTEEDNKTAEHIPRPIRNRRPPIIFCLCEY